MRFSRHKMKISKIIYSMEASMNNLPRHFYRTAAALLLFGLSYPALSAQDKAPAALPDAKAQEVTAAKAGVADETTAKERITREADLAKADSAMDEGTRYFERGEYQNAIEKYSKVIDILKPAGSTLISTPNVEKEIDAAKKSINMAYFNWAMECLELAEQNSNLGEFDSAIANCKKAIEVYPQCKNLSEERIAKYEKMRNSLEYTSSLSLEQINREIPDKLLQIESLLEQGRNFYKVGRWDKARDRFNYVIALDPYNATAIDYLRRTYKKLTEAGEYRREVEINKGVSEIIWEMVAPVYTELDQNRDDKRPKVDIITDPTKTIRGKLDTITIDNLEFEAVDIRTVIKHLRRRSKERDPDQEGVNFVLLLPTEATVTTDGATNAGLEAADDTDLGFEDGEEAGAADSGTLYPISVQSNNVPLSTAIKYVCESGDLHFRIDENAVVIAPKSVTLATFERQDYPLDKDALTASVENPEDPAELQKYFEARAVTFEPGATISYKPDISRLYVKNTPENHAQIAEIIRNLDALDPQVLIQVKFIEINNNDLEELGFQYIVSRDSSNGLLNDLQSSSPQQILPAPSETTPNTTKIGDTYYYTAPTDLVLWDYSSTEGTPILGDRGSTSLPKQVNNYSIIKKGDYFTFSGDGDVYTTPYSTGKSATTFSPNDPLVRSAGEDPNVFGGNTGVNDGLFKWSWYNSNGYKANVTVNAVDLADSSDVLSTPRIMTMNSQQAMIRMVTEKYYPTEWSEADIGTISSGNQTIPVITPSIPTFGEATEEGIILSVTPTVDPEDNFTINLQMTPTIQHMVGWTDYSYQAPLGDNGDLFTNVLKMPIIEKRQVDTTVSCFDGETIVLGGIIKDSLSEVDDQYPILGDLPLVGRLFQTKGRGSQKTNLLIFLTCKLVHPDGTPIREHEERGVPSF